MEFRIGLHSVGTSSSAATKEDLGLHFAAAGGFSSAEVAPGRGRGAHHSIGARAADIPHLTPAHPLPREAAPAGAARWSPAVRPKAIHTPTHPLPREATPGGAVRWWGPKPIHAPVPPS